MRTECPLRSKSILGCILTALLFSSACSYGAARPSRALRVYAGASLSEALTEVGSSFEDSRPGETVEFNFGGSQNLRTQIEQGAAADVFVSANWTEMDALVMGGFIKIGAPRILVTNELTVIVPAGNPAGLSSLQDLGRPGLKIVLAAEEVPAGKYALQVLDNLAGVFGAGYKGRVMGNVVSLEDNVRQVVTKVQLGEADAGIVYVSDAVAAPELKTITIPAESNVIAEYPIAPLIGSAKPDLAAAFIGYLLSPGAQAVFKRSGFTSAVP